MFFQDFCFDGLLIRTDLLLPSSSLNIINTPGIPGKFLWTRNNLIESVASCIIKDRENHIVVYFRTSVREDTYYTMIDRQKIREIYLVFWKLKHTTVFNECAHIWSLQCFMCKALFIFHIRLISVLVCLRYHRIELLLYIRRILFSFVCQYQTTKPSKQQHK